MTSQKSTLPIPSAYWVRPGQLLAGGYPTMLQRERADEHLERFLDAGVDHFIDLTEPDEFPAPYQYEALCLAQAARLGRRALYQRFAIPDMDVPPPALMVAILDALDVALAAGRRPYVHCHAGAGRTGTVIGCHLVRHGLSGPDALERLERLREHIPPQYWYPSPYRAVQREMVLGWRG